MFTNSKLIFTRSIHANLESQLASAVSRTRIRLRSGETHHGIHLKIHNGYESQMPLVNIKQFYIDLDKTCDTLWRTAAEAMDRYRNSNQWRVDYYLLKSGATQPLGVRFICTKWPENVDEEAYFIRVRHSNAPLSGGLTIRVFSLAPLSPALSTAVFILWLGAHHLRSPGNSYYSESPH